eukprot:scaffold48221_cov51-Phaeocystis_antarctica.AAC.6
MAGGQRVRERAAGDQRPQDAPRRRRCGARQAAADGAAQAVGGVGALRRRDAGGPQAPPGARRRVSPPIRDALGARGRRAGGLERAAARGAPDARRRGEAPPRDQGAQAQVSGRGSNPASRPAPCLGSRLTLLACTHSQAADHRD